MDITIFKEAQEAYTRHEYEKALVGFTACSREVGELSQAETCKFYHLIGNCYIKSGQPAKAVEYYIKALELSTPERKPSLMVNLGTAYLSCEDLKNALASFTKALECRGYATPYKALSGIGAVQLKLGEPEKAGAAYREAALDPANPSPSKALVNLGVCFMELDRSKDAISTYETALDLGLSTSGTNKCLANLGQAYLAEGRVADALAAFDEATADGSYKLSPVAAHDRSMARSLQARFGNLLGGFEPEPEPESEPEPEELAEEPVVEPEPEAIDEGTFGAEVALADDAADAEDADDNALESEEAHSGSNNGKELVSAEADGAVEPEQTDKTEVVDLSAAETQVFPVIDAATADSAEPADNDGMWEPATAPDKELSQAFEAIDKDDEALIPSPEDTAFFSISEEQINADAKEERHKARKKHTGLKIALGVVIVLILLVVACAVAYVRGYGWPLQEAVAKDFVAAASAGQSTDAYWDDSVTQESRDSQMTVLEGVTDSQVIAVMRSSSSSEVYMSATLNGGGKVYYEITMGRNLIGWDVQFVELYFPSEH